MGPSEQHPLRGPEESKPKKWNLCSHLALIQCLLNSAVTGLWVCGLRYDTAWYQWLMGLPHAREVHPGIFVSGTPGYYGAELRKFGMVINAQSQEQIGES